MIDYSRFLCTPNLEDLGDEFDISQQAVGSRLRRGIKHILRSTIPETEHPDR